VGEELCEDLGGRVGVALWNAGEDEDSVKRGEGPSGNSVDLVDLVRQMGYGIPTRRGASESLRTARLIRACAGAGVQNIHLHRCPTHKKGEFSLYCDELSFWASTRRRGGRLGRFLF
jgi:hypothetical protein